MLTESEQYTDNQLKELFEKSKGNWDADPKNNNNNNGSNNGNNNSNNDNNDKATSSKAATYTSSTPTNTPMPEPACCAGVRCTIL